MNNNISFGGNFIKKLPVLKYSYKEKNYKPAYANLVELESHNIKDVNAIEEIAKSFGGDSYVNNMSYNAKLAYERGQNDKRFGALILTKQAGNFEEIDADEVLGVAEILKIKNGEIKLMYLQTDPCLVYSYGQRSVKNIGSAILNYLKDINNKISLLASSSAIRFYLKHDFKLVSEDCSRMVWAKKK